MSRVMELALDHVFKAIANVTRLRHQEIKMFLWRVSRHDDLSRVAVVCVGDNLTQRSVPTDSARKSLVFVIMADLSVSIPKMRWTQSDQQAGTCRKLLGSAK